MEAKTLALYLGCDVMVTPYEGASYKCKLCGVVEEKLGGETDVKIRVFEDDGPEGYEGHGHKWFDEQEIELLLRPLSSMRIEELNETFNISFATRMAEEQILMISKSLHGLYSFLSRYGNWNSLTGLRCAGFDCDNLIEMDEALDLTKL